MCGVAGLMTLDGTSPPTAPLRAMEAALRHRGPDGVGQYRAPGIGMVQTRLAIIDLATGAQPLYEPGGAALIANAEIYNYIELREELRGGLRSVVFSTQSDCELPLHLYRRHGLDFTEHLRGMYAIALHDPAARRLVLTRDPFGIKPLYYAESANGFAFASEPNALIEAGIVTPRLQRHGRDELVQMQFTTGRETVFAGINRVLPGETVIVREGRIVDRQRRAALPEHGPVAFSEDEALARLDAALAASVRMHQRSDVPFGLFLSGGVDSTAVLAMMARLAERPVKAFTIGFADGEADERPAAREAAAAVGAEHVEVAFTEADFWRLLPEIVSSIDDPAADYAILPTWILARTARAAGVKVILSGEGGDELFAGYGRYRSLMRPWWAGGRRPRARGILDDLGLLRGEITGWRDGIAAAEALSGRGARTSLQAAQAVDCSDWLPNDLLTKLDRCLMAHGSEGRTPYLDSELAGLALRLPDDFKIRRGLGKWVLRRWLTEHLPQAQPFARKRGLTVPVARWIARRAEAIGPLVARSPAVREICRPEAVENLFAAADQKRAGRAAWVLLFYALWHRRHIERITLPPDTLAALSDRD
ncbi:MAG: asparagine synthase (glutamine-hydrolyzing) [Alphaproteobacteria bacterium]|nr:asparagine synthase (glutamine-hydrolyzing) [Alphaproteobacteria bacterium]